MSEIQGVGRLKFHDGKLEEFKRLSVQAMEIARAKDTGTLQYEVYLSDDQSEGIVLEWYRDSEALLEHAANLGEIGEAILATGSGSSVLLGEPSADLRAILAGGPVRTFTPFVSMLTPLASPDQAAPRSDLPTTLIDADERTRTSTDLHPHGPEPCASTNSATSACLQERRYRTQIGDLLR